jgi:hypothetical protein
MNVPELFARNVPLSFIPPRLPQFLKQIATLAYQQGALFRGE